MILGQADKLITLRSGLDSAYNRNLYHIVLDEVIRDYEQETVGMLIQENNLEKQWKIKSDKKFASVFKN